MSGKYALAAAILFSIIIAAPSCIGLFLKNIDSNNSIDMSAFSLTALSTKECRDIFL